MMTEALVLEKLRERPDLLAPLRITVAEIKADRPDRRFDALVDVKWGEASWKFVAKVKRLATPRILEEAIRQVQVAADYIRLSPLVIVPYLSDAQLNNLASKSMSAIDLCGNGVLQIPGELLVSRRGERNLYPSSTPIRKVYKGTSSLVARVFLARPDFPSVGEVRAEILRRGGGVALSTVSRVLKTMSEDLVIRRKGHTCTLMQPDELLDRLAAGFSLPVVRRRITAQWEGSGDPSRAITAAGADEHVRTVMTGAGSSDRFTVAGRENVTSFYCADADAIANKLGRELKQATRFADMELLETDDLLVYFDSRLEDGAAVASPVQCWLELQSGDKREQQAARQVRNRILAEVSSMQRERRS